VEKLSWGLWESYTMCAARHGDLGRNSLENNEIRMRSGEARLGAMAELTGQLARLAPDRE